MWLGENLSYGPESAFFDSELPVLPHNPSQLSSFIYRNLSPRPLHPSSTLPQELPTIHQTSILTITRIII